MYETKKTTFLLNWYANPYHTPIFVAKEKGWFLEEVRFRFCIYFIDNVII